MKNFKKTLFSFIFVAVFVTYAVFQRYSSSSPSNIVTQSSNPNPVAITSTSSGKYKDGIYVGSNSDAYYGSMQVQVTIAGGKITDVKFLSYPQDRTTSATINTRAMLSLKQEAIAAQSANVNVVSGATDSSTAFVQSLSAALSQAS